MANNFASFRNPATGEAILSKDAPTGIPYYQSAGVDKTTGMSTQGDVFNPFRGLVSPEGGTFGGAGAANRGGFESLSGVSADKLGDTSSYTPADWANVNHIFGGIANGDKATRISAAQSDNPFIRDTARAYLSGSGSQGFDQSAWDAFTKANPTWAGATAATPTPTSPMATTDPFAQFGAPPAPTGDPMNPDMQPNAGVSFQPSSAFLRSAPTGPLLPTDLGGQTSSTPGTFGLGQPQAASAPPVFAGGQMAATGPAGMTARGGYPGMQGRRYAMAGLNRFRRPGAGGPQFGQQQDGLLGGAGGAGGGSGAAY